MRTGGRLRACRGPRGCQLRAARRSPAWRASHPGRPLERGPDHLTRAASPLWQPSNPARPERGEAGVGQRPSRRRRWSLGCSGRATGPTPRPPVCLAPRHRERPGRREIRLPGKPAARDSAAPRSWRWTARRPYPSRGVSAVPTRPKNSLAMLRFASAITDPSTACQGSRYGKPATRYRGRMGGGEDHLRTPKAMTRPARVGSPYNRGGGPRVRAGRDGNPRGHPPQDAGRVLGRTRTLSVLGPWFIHCSYVSNPTVRALRSTAELHGRPRR